MGWPLGHREGLGQLGTTGLSFPGKSWTAGLARGDLGALGLNLLMNLDDFSKHVVAQGLTTQSEITLEPNGGRKEVYLYLG